MQFMTKLDERHEKLERAIESKTHGSGLDYKYEFKWRGRFLTIDTFFHPMNEHGYYMSPVPVKVRIDTLSMSVLSIRCQSLGYGLADVLYNVFIYGLEHVKYSCIVNKEEL